MGEKNFYQPLTREDKITVILYRTGIVMSSLIMAISAYLMLSFSNLQSDTSVGFKVTALIIMLYVSVGLSVFFIHLYVSRFKRALIRLYFLSILGLVALFIIGKGDLSAALAQKPFGLLLLIPLSVCLGFITAKEAFCFKLMEGYVLALIMPICLFLLSIRPMPASTISYVLALIAAMLVFFTLRKVFMPLHFDIGDKSAYS